MTKVQMADPEVRPDVVESQQEAAQAMKVVSLDAYREQQVQARKQECSHPSNQRVAKPDPDDPEWCWVVKCLVCGEIVGNGAWG